MGTLTKDRTAAGSQQFTGAPPNVDKSTCTITMRYSQLGRARGCFLIKECRLLGRQVLGGRISLLITGK